MTSTAKTAENKMHKYRGFPSRLPGTDFHFTIRRAHKTAPPQLKARPRYADRRARDLDADKHFLASLIEYFGTQSFARGNLDAGRLSWLFEREVVPAEADFNPRSYEALLKIDMQRARISFPEIFVNGQNLA